MSVKSHHGFRLEGFGFDLGFSAGTEEASDAEEPLDGGGGHGYEEKAEGGIRDQLNNNNVSVYFGVAPHPLPK